MHAILLVHSRKLYLPDVLALPQYEGLGVEIWQYKTHDGSSIPLPSCPVFL